MASEPQQVKGRDHTLSTLDVLIQALNLARDTCGIPSAQAVFGSVSALLSTIKVHPLPFCSYDLPAHAH